MTRSAHLPAGAPGTEEDVVSTYVEIDRADARSFRVSCAIAVLVHGVFLCTAIPSWQAMEAEPAAKPKAIRLSATPRFRPPPPDPPPRNKLRQKVTSIPVPDQDPDDDPYIVDLAPDVVLEIDDTYLDLPVAPPPPKPVAAAPTEPIRVGGRLAAPERTFYVQPRYPAPAKRARIEGTVVLEATIDTDGQVVDLKVVAGRPLGLSEAALDAVARWRFEPSVLNGQPVPVLYRVEVSFTLR
ncbi:MAG: energy transducer TonB [Acidobacteriota bacterium]